MGCGVTHTKVAFIHLQDKVFVVCKSWYNYFTSLISFPLSFLSPDDFIHQYESTTAKNLSERDIAGLYSFDSIVKASFSDDSSGG